MGLADCVPAVETGPVYSPSGLQALLSCRSRKRVLLMMTDNTCSMLVVKPVGADLVEVRAHRMFLDAPAEVVDEIVLWIRGQQVRGGAIQAYIDANEDRIRARDPLSRMPTIRVRGRYYDLREVRDRINATYLDGRSKALVTWGRKVTRRRTRTVRLGTYDPALDLITMSRRLDRSDIPRYMIEYVMFHEMLHEVLGISQLPDGRRDIHNRTFRLMEQTFPYYRRAREFEARKWG